MSSSEIPGNSPLECCPGTPQPGHGQSLKTQPKIPNWVGIPDWTSRLEFQVRTINNFSKPQKDPEFWLEFQARPGTTSPNPKMTPDFVGIPGWNAKSDHGQPLQSPQKRSQIWVEFQVRPWTPLQTQPKTPNSIGIPSDTTDNASNPRKKIPNLSGIPGETTKIPQNLNPPSQIWLEFQGRLWTALNPKKSQIWSEFQAGIPGHATDNPSKSQKRSQIWSNPKSSPEPPPL